MPPPRIPVYLELYDRVFTNFDDYMKTTDTWTARTYKTRRKQTIAYFSMEFGLHETLPIYSGGLGVLAGDHMKQASDLGLPLVGMGLMYAEGYFSQRISEDGWQDASNNLLNFDELPVLPVLNKKGETLKITINFPDRAVNACIWELRVGRIPLYLLDSDLDENTPNDRKLTARLVLERHRPARRPGSPAGIRRCARPTGDGLRSDRLAHE